MRPYGGNFTNFLALMVNLLRNAVNLQIDEYGVQEAHKV